MSGIVGLVNTIGNPVDRGLLTALTGRLRRRGPDGHQLWIDGNVGFGHTLFATTNEAWHERQPCSLDGEAWIVADARVDGRDELKRKLTLRGRTGLTNANDAELLLHAYHAWGEECVDHLLGDFVFAIWNRRTRRLLCVRDHFGVRPFFYAHCRGELVFSNTFECIRHHPQIPDTIDERTVGDFLLFKCNTRADHTGLTEVLRLAPGHVLTWSANTDLRVRRYWSLSQPAEIRYRQSADYVEHFREVFDVAVRDRLRTAKVAVSMSGGMDSSMVAAAAKAALMRVGTAFELRAHTAVFELLPDEERHYASLVADKIGIPIQFLGVDAFAGYEPGDTADYQWLPEPADTRFLQMDQQFRAGVMVNSRVMLSGNDGDSLLNEHAYRYFAALWHTRRVWALASAVLRYAVWLRRRPPIGLRAALRRWREGDETQEFPYPGWLSEEFAARLDLRARWHEVRGSLRCQDHTLRPRAMETIPRAWWRVFENADFTSTGQLLENRWPFADLRVVEFLLSIPAVPWCTNKTIAREATKGTLPDAVRRRKKTPLLVDPLVEKLRLPEARWIDEFAATAALSRYVNRQKIPPLTGAFADADCYLNVRPLLLNWWLKHGVGCDRGEEHDRDEDDRKRVGVEPIIAGAAEAVVQPT